MSSTETLQLKNYSISRPDKPEGTYVMSNEDMTSAPSFEGVWMRFMMLCGKLHNGDVEDKVAELDDCNRRLRLLARAVEELGELNAAAGGDGKNPSAIKDIDGVKKKYVGPDGKFSIDVLQAKVDEINKLLLEANVDAAPLFDSKVKYVQGNMSDAELGEAAFDLALEKYSRFVRASNGQIETPILFAMYDMKTVVGSGDAADKIQRDKAAGEALKGLFFSRAGSGLDARLTEKDVDDFLSGKNNNIYNDDFWKRFPNIDKGVVKARIMQIFDIFYAERNNLIAERTSLRAGPGLENALSIDTKATDLNTGISRINGAIEELKTKQQKLNTELSSLTQQLNTFMDSARSALAKFNETSQKLVRDF